MPEESEAEMSDGKNDLLEPGVGGLVSQYESGHDVKLAAQRLLIEDLTAERDRYRAALEQISERMEQAGLVGPWLSDINRCLLSNAATPQREMLPDMCPSCSCNPCRCTSDSAAMQRKPREFWIDPVGDPSRWGKFDAYPVDKYDDLIHVREVTSGGATTQGEK